MGAMNQRIELRCTDDEKVRLQAEADAAGLKLSALIRQRTLGAVSSGSPDSAAPSSDKGLGGSSAPAAASAVASPTASPRAPGMTARGCEQCGRGIGSPTMRRCPCGGRIVPPPKGA